MLSELSEINIKKVVFGGEGMGHFSGKTCFVEGALAGETVSVEVLQEKKDYLKGRVLRILNPSVFRVTPPCPYVDACGGCQYQHVSYEEELRLKGAQVAERLAGIGQIPEEVLRPVVGSPREFGYRNSVTLHATLPGDKRPQQLCFIGKDNAEKVVIDRCLLADERLEPVFQKIFSLRKQTKRVTFKLSEDGEIVSDAADRFLKMRIGPESFLLNAKGFFQVNLSVAELLAAKIGEWVEAAQADVFFDLYAGVGTFSFLCAGHVPRIFAVEESPFGAQGARMNRQEKHPPHMEILETKVEKAFAPLWAKAKAGRAFILLDPPRQGLHKHFVEFIASGVRAAALAYVSCDLPRLGRDLNLMLRGGYYKVREVQAFDMFPKTKHIETAVLLVPKG